MSFLERAWRVTKMKSEETIILKRLTQPNRNQDQVWSQNLSSSTTLYGWVWTSMASRGFRWFLKERLCPHGLRKAWEKPENLMRELAAQANCLMMRFSAFSQAMWTKPKKLKKVIIPDSDKPTKCWDGRTPVTRKSKGSSQRKQKPEEKTNQP